MNEIEIKITFTPWKTGIAHKALWLNHDDYIEQVLVYIIKPDRLNYFLEKYNE